MRAQIFRKRLSKKTPRICARARRTSRIYALVLVGWGKVLSQTQRALILPFQMFCGKRNVLLLFPFLVFFSLQSSMRLYRRLLCFAWQELITLSRNRGITCSKVLSFHQARGVDVSTVCGSWALRETNVSRAPKSKNVLNIRLTSECNGSKGLHFEGLDETGT
jgi:hypothetical protein